jgi:translation initiation factor IF-2
MRTNAGVEVELDYGDVINIIVEDLKEWYRSDDFKKERKAIKKVLKMYMTHDEAKEFFRG